MFVALAIQHEKCMSRLVTCGLSGSAKFFSHYIIKGKIFEKKIAEHKMCSWIFFTILAKKILILRRK
jgi:hypothetical protein